MMWPIIAFSSALFSAAAAIAQKRVLFRLPALEFSFLVSCVIAVFSCGFLFVVDVTALDRIALLLVAGKSVIGGVAFLLVMTSLRKNQISTALPLLGMTPGVTALLAFAVLGESLRPLEWAGVLLMIAGTYLLEKPESGHIVGSLKLFRFQRTHSPIYAAVFLFAASSVLDRLLLAGMRIDVRIVLFYQNLIYCCLFAVMLLVRRVSIPRVLAAGKEHLLMIAMIALLTLAYRLAQMEATKLAPVALVLAIKRTSILFASFFGGRLFLDDRLSTKLTAAALIVASGFLILRNVG